MADIGSAILTDHALGRMARRRIDESEVRRILAQPEAVLPDRPGRLVAQGMSGNYLLRVFVDIDRQPPEVVLPTERVE